MMMIEKMAIEKMAVVKALGGLGHIERRRISNLFRKMVGKKLKKPLRDPKKVHPAIREKLTAALGS